MGYSGLFACMQLPLTVSPVSASFIGLQRRGILPVLSSACAAQLLLFIHTLQVAYLLLCLHFLLILHSFLLFSFVLFLLSAKLK